MKFLLTLISLVVVAASPSAGEQPAVPSPRQQIAAAVLPLPEVMRGGAGVVGYGADLSLVTLRPSSNGMVCTGTRPGDDTFDVRCYHEKFLPIVRRLQELYKEGKSEKEVGEIVGVEVKAGKLALPDRPTAGYRMLGPLSAYDAAHNTVGKEIESWQSIHFPYKTAAEIGLPEEGTVPRTMPYVMASGTIWSHVMIEHEIRPDEQKK
jgi:hypothetical protein